MNDDQKRADELGALWVKQGPKGEFMTGSCICTACGVKQDVVAFSNSFKTKDSHPAWRLLKSRPKEDRVSTRRDERPHQRPEAEEFDSRQTAQTGWPSTAGEASRWPKPGQQQGYPLSKPKQSRDWTDDVPPQMTEDDIPF